MKHLRPLILMAFFTLLLTAGAQNQRTYETARISGKVPVIDGLLKDAAWDDVPWGEQFTQHEPFDNKPPSQNTRFKILFDDDNVYVAIQALDSIPSAIVDRMTRRDNSDADWVGVIFDSYDDNLTGFGFAVTASGVKFDLMITNDGQDDETWDALWIGKANIDSEGWTAEFRIPLSQLRFARKEEMTWGMNIFRYVYRKQELSLWQPIARNAPGFVSFFGDLKGLKGIHPRKDIEILPYVVGKTEQNEVEAGDPFSRKSRNTGSVGVDGKIAVTNDMTLNFTINPDFGQVEADPSVVNLTAFESYFSEKRPFFIEGKNIFNYRLTGGDDEGTLNMLFYSRRIGRPPHHYPDLGDQEYADVPVNTHILGSFKLSGKTRNGLSVGIQESIAKRERADIDKAGARSKMDVEPMTNYVVARVQKDYNKGISSLGGMITATNRTIREDQLNYLPTSAYAAGLDFSHTWKNKTYYYTIKGLVTRLGGDEKAITEIQRSSAHYYQCPDKDYVKLDSSRTSLSGFAGTFEIGKQGNGKISYMAWLTMRSPGVDFNDLGYMRNADEIQQVFWVGYRQFDSTRYFRSYNINFNEYVGYNFGGTALYKGVNINAHGQLHNYWNLNAGFNLDGESLDLSQLRGGPGLRTPGGINARTFISSDQRKKFTLELNLWIYKGFHDYTTNQGVYFGGTFKPLKSLSISLYPNFSYGYNHMQYVTKCNYLDQPRYIIAKLDQKSLGISLRIDYALTPDISVQFYGQPFLFSGNYSRYKRISDPKASEYESRYYELREGTGFKLNSDNNRWEVDENRDDITDYYFSNDNFNFMQFRSNLVFRWEYKPGSALYLVWSQGRTESTSYGDFLPRRDFKDLYNKHPQDIFLLKVSYMLVF